MKKKVGIVLDEVLYGQLKDAARRDNRTISDIIELGIRRYLRERAFRTMLRLGERLSGAGISAQETHRISKKMLGGG